MSAKRVGKSSYFSGDEDPESDGIVAEDPAVILARRAREDELCERMQQVVTNFDKYLENREKSKNEVDDKEVDQIVASFCSDGGSVLHDGRTITYRGWSRSETVVEAGRCFRVFSAESLSPGPFFRGVPAACSACQWLLELPSWREVVGHAQPFAQKTVMHPCPVTRAFPLYIFFLMSVCEDEVAVRQLHRALTACQFEQPLTLQDFMTVFYNWGFREELLLYDFKPSAVLGEMECKEKPETDSKMVVEATDGNPDGETQFPVHLLAISNTLKFMANRVHQLDLQEEDEDLVLAGLRMFVAAQAEKTVDFALYNLRSLIYEMFDCFQVYQWPEERRQKLVYALHMREFNIFNQFSCIKALVDPSNIKGPVCFAVLQSLHGVEPDEVVYVTELCAAHLSKLPPGPVDWAELPPDQIYLSLQVLADCVSCVAAADAEDPALHGRLLRCLYRMQHRLPRMSVLDVNTIKTLICHLDFLWKALLRENLEKQGNVSFMKYMRELVNN